MARNEPTGMDIVAISGLQVRAIKRPCDRRARKPNLFLVPLLWPSSPSRHRSVVECDVPADARLPSSSFGAAFVAAPPGLRRSRR
jgi:hypothetical protein